MTTVSGLILTKILGWNIKGEYPNIEKSIVIFAPHTSYYDSVYGKLFINEAGVNHKFLSKKELFFFPLNILMKWYGSIPVRGVKGENAIYLVAKMLEEKESLHIIMSPEGHLARTDKWNKGFCYMALKAKVPIVVGYLDYQKKEIGVKGVINNFESVDTVMDQVNMMYKDVAAKYPENFSLEQR
ncbi:1-acyl-sn-glycerol-3-phosphate acyltransferase [uncultured Acetobacteroides sp.]|uniref:1-acyl-sn-glycerol-3-phosphate acyltransferase n=1 Tax=uncultured Acetobacteroides sp. TaxID=1760811 RepID=UPI0029F523CD|nr:1-acyl-sn-glycerol-3-phosphate acyltransferase [uncultured Acetobacteroides sp.]